MSIDSIGGVTASAQGFAKPESIQQKDKSSFSNILSDAVNSIKNTEAEAANAQSALVTGESSDLHTSLITALKAETAISFTVEIRNRVLESYNSIMNMQV